MSAFVVGAVPFLIPDDEKEIGSNENSVRKNELRVSESEL